MKDINSVSFYWFMVLLSIFILIVSACEQLVNENYMIDILYLDILYFGSFISAVIFLYLIECKNGK